MKITATIHQIQLTREEGNTLNRVGREAFHALEEKFRVNDEIRISGVDFQPGWWQYYTQQGRIEILSQWTWNSENPNTLLGRIFEAGNDDGHGPLASAYNRYSTALNISIGDIIILGETAYMVSPTGFKQVDIEEPV